MSTKECGASMPGCPALLCARRVGHGGAHNHCRFHLDEHDSSREAAPPRALQATSADVSRRRCVNPKCRELVGPPITVGRAKVERDFCHACADRIRVLNDELRSMAAIGGTS